MRRHQRGEGAGQGEDERDVHGPSLLPPHRGHDVVVVDRPVLCHAAGGFHAFPTTITTDQFIDSSDKLFGADATIFGVSVAQLPSCVETTETTDSFIGSGMHASISQMVPSKFQLVMQVGKSAGNESGQKTNVVSIDLPTPSASPRIDSWAAIVE